MITLHESNITSMPLDNGIGVLSDAITAPAEEELNGMFEFTMEYPSDGYLVEEIKEERIIKAKAQDKLGYQLFRIYKINKNHDNDNLTIHAQHITYDLGNNFIEALNASGLTKQQVMQLIGASTVDPHTFNITSPNNSTRSSTKLYRTNPLQMIAGMEGSVLQIWGGQIERDNFNLILHDRRGHDDGVTITYEKNITGLEAVFDISGLITRIFPFVLIEATDDSPERLITVKGNYIDSEHINDYEQIFIEPIDYTHNDRMDLQDKTDAEIRTQLTNLANSYFEETDNDKPKVTLSVNFAHLWETEEYKNVAPLELVGMGDTVTVEHSRLGIEATAIVNRIVYDSIAEVNTEVGIGNVKARFSDNINKIDRIEQKVEEAQSNANHAITAANGKNTIFYGPDEPTSGMILNDTWFEQVDNQFVRTWRFDGIQWQAMIDMDSYEAKQEAQQAKDRANEAYDNANLANQNAMDAINNAQSAFDKAQESLTGLTTLAGFVDDNTGEITTIKGSVEGLQATVQGKVDNNTFTTFVQQTNSSLAGKISMADAEGVFVKGTTFSATIDGLQTTVQNKADKSTVTQLAGVVDTKISTTDANNKFATQSQLTQTSNSLMSTIISVRNDLDELEIGGRNLITKDSITTHNATTADNHTFRLTKTESSTNPHMRIPHTLFENDTNYVVTFKVKKISGIITQLSGHATLAVHSTTRVFIDGKEITPLNTGWSNTKENSYPDDTNTHHVEIRFKTVSDVSSVSTPYWYIQPNRPNYGPSYVIDIWDWQLEKGNIGTDYSPAVEDMATQSQISQLSNAINLRVTKADLINQINIDTTGILISGKKLILDGDTTVNGTFKLDGSANIKDASIGTAQIASIDAGKVVSGTLDTNVLNVRGGSATDYTLIQGSFLESRGQYTNTWFGTTLNHDVVLRLNNGYIQAHDLTNGQRLNFTAQGISTYIGGSNEDDDGVSGSGVIEFFSHIYNPTVRGLTLYSNRGIIGLKTAFRDIILDSARNVIVDSENSVYLNSEDGSVYLRPHRTSVIGNNEFRFWVKPNPLASDTDGVLVFGSPLYGFASGIRFKKDNVGPPTVWITNGNGDKNGGAHLVTRSLELTDGGILDAYNIRSNRIRTLTTNSYLYLGTDEGVRITSRGTNDNNPIIYRPLYAGELTSYSAVKFGDNGRIANDNGLRTYIQGNDDVSATRYLSGTLVPMRAAEFNSGSLAEYKQDIKEWDIDILEIYREITIYDYMLNSDVEEGKMKRRQGLVIGTEYNTPLDLINGDGIAQYQMNSWNMKGIQELTVITDDLCLKIDSTREELVLKIAKLEERLNTLEAA